jgi:Na+/proline symporter/signal transduction histidine kinase
MLTPAVVIGASVAYLGLLFGVAWWADQRAAAGRSVIDRAWIYALSMGVYCTAWTYFGSIGRAASGGLWFLPIYLGPTLAMVLGAVLLPRMIRIAQTNRITSIADFIASRHGKSPAVAALVTVITVVGLVPYLALQLKAISVGYAALTGSGPSTGVIDSTLVIAMLLAGFTIVFGTRHLDASERHEGMVAAIAAESVVKLLAFVAVGVFVVWGLFDGPADLFGRALATPALDRLWQLSAGAPPAAGPGGAAPGPGHAPSAWFALTLLAMLSVLFLPRQFQVMVVEAVDERHVRRAAWVFPLYLFAINLFVLPIAVGGLLHLGPGVGAAAAETFVLTLPLAAGHETLALVAFIGGLSAATGMVIVETIAVSTMVCNDLVLPGLLRSRRFAAPGRSLAAGQDLSRLVLAVRRFAIVGVLLLGYVYFRLAGEAYALVSIGLISFAAVAQFAPALLGGLLWRGGTRDGALAGLGIGSALWAYTLLLPSIAKSGWLDDTFLREGLFGIALLRPEQLLGLTGLDSLTHAIFWSLLANTVAYVGVSLWRGPNATEAAQAMLWLDASLPARHPPRPGVAGAAGVAAGPGLAAPGTPPMPDAIAPVFWRGTARVDDLRGLLQRFLGAERAQRLLAEHLRARDAAGRPAAQRGDLADAALVQFVETQLAGAIGTASARVMVSSVVDEESLDLDDVMRILDETSREALQLRAYSQELESQRLSLERAGHELRAANEQLQSLDRLKDDFMSSVTHELRTPLTAIRALAELMRDDPDMPAEQRQQFLGIIVAEGERLSRLVNQVLDMAKIESGHAQWQVSQVDLPDLLRRAALAVAELFREKGAELELHLGPLSRTLEADADRLMQVVINLLSNAAKFVPQPGGRVVLALAETATGVQVTVADNGPGVPAGQQALIFEKFRQGGDADHRPPGTGLGLPISRQIVEHFGGRLWLRAGDATSSASDPRQGSVSQPGQDPGAALPGAVFGFDLPWTRAADVAAADAASTPPTASPSPQETPHAA